MNLRQIGERVSRRRKEKGLTIGEFAQALHIVPRSAVLIESGQANIDLQCLLDMCTCLDRTPNQLLDGNYTVSDQTKIDDALALVGVPEPEQEAIRQPGGISSTVITDNMTARKKIEEMIASYKGKSTNPYHR